MNNSSNQYLLYLQNNWNTNGTVGNDVECFGSTVVNTSMTCLSQGYGYDNLNQLSTSGENYYQNPSSGAGYSRNFSYDEYGNISVSASANAPTSGLMPQTSQSPFNTANNQLKTATYADPRGNMTLVAAGSVSMSYDSESRQTKTVDPGTGVTMNYLYDAAGQRVQKQSSNGTTTVDVHDVFGQLVAEYSRVGVTPACTTCYLTYDGLGSVRLVTDQNAGIVTRHDYLPYGEEIPNGSAGRCCNNFGNTANVTQMFTGQERDGGTADLDYFNARHMSNILGRFTQPDPGGAGADVTNPQTWNAYAYVAGNPLGMTDPSGMVGVGNGTDEETYEWNVGDYCGGICYFPPSTTHHAGATYGGGTITVASLPPSNPSPVAPTPSPVPPPSSDPTPVMDPYVAGILPHVPDPSETFPTSPAGVGPQWQIDLGHRDPNEIKWTHNGWSLEWNAAQPGKPGNRSKDHRHLTDPDNQTSRDEHHTPGSRSPVPIGKTNLMMLLDALSAIGKLLANPPSSSAGPLPPLPPWVVVLP